MVGVSLGNFIHGANISSISGGLVVLTDIVVVIPRLTRSI
jgi:hypothetical protein